MDVPELVIVLVCVCVRARGGGVNVKERRCAQIVEQDVDRINT